MDGDGGVHDPVQPACGRAQPGGPLRIQVEASPAEHRSARKLDPFRPARFDTVDDALFAEPEVTVAAVGKQAVGMIGRQAVARREAPHPIA